MMGRASVKKTAQLTDEPRMVQMTFVHGGASDLDYAYTNKAKAISPAFIRRGNYNSTLGVMPFCSLGKA